MIIAGSGIEAGSVCNTAASHVDVLPFVLQCVGVEDEESLTQSLPGTSLYTLAAGATPDRSVISDYHGMGSTTAAFMLRLEHYKYVHYVAYPDQLFDLSVDPKEINDVAADPEYANVVMEAKDRLAAMLNPANVDRQAKRRQAALLEANGGREAVIARGDLGLSVPPGVEPMFD
jgi:choline-sulfatase